jgi:uncharacterized damage-inducible protein DinB/predicted RNase H-like HicB family nuclease
MTQIPVYLEIAEDGRCMAHVLSLPGLVVREQTKERALHSLPEAIRDYHAWLHRHGEPVPPVDELMEIQVAGESVGFGPFERRNAAALFPPDRDPVGREEMESFFRLMDHGRADLLALVCSLPSDLLDWHPAPGSLSIRELLRHVGNAEEWYVSRLVPAETLPPEWEHDENMPIFEFLEMERHTAIERLRQLTEEQRSVVFHPTGWTDHPQEPWTARKALRRFLEHEREHTWQVREILDAFRRRLLARLAAERAGLLNQVIGLDEGTLTGMPVIEQWTAKDLLAHAAAWDRWHDRTMKTMLAGEDPDLSALDDFDTSNEAIWAEWRDRLLDDVLTELQTARADWVTWLEGLPVEDFFRARSFGGSDWSFFTDPLVVQWQHDAEHAEQLARWRQAQMLAKGRGPKSVLAAALAAARQDLLAAAALVPAQQRLTEPIEGEWTLKDLLGHIADWEWFAVQGMRYMAAGQPPDVEHVEDIDAWNRAHVESRRGQPWEHVWEDLHDMRGALLEILEGTSDEALTRAYPFPWGGEGTAYRWLLVFLDHDREHARHLRRWE